MINRLVLLPAGMLGWYFLTVWGVSQWGFWFILLQGLTIVGIGHLTGNDE
jgi:hypothetical protein